jgi:hypothetical protein
MSQNQPGVYAKGDQRKEASSPAEAVALKFQGFKLVEDESPAEQPEDVQPSQAAVPDSDAAFESTERHDELNGTENPFQI